MEKRKTAKDYRTEYKTLLTKVDKLEANIGERLAILCAQHPDLVIVKASLDKTPVHAKDVQLKGLNTIKLKISTIEAIENALEGQHPHQQGDLFN